jgi:3'(2'), 5'-bisphosphate nucleotidase
MVSTRPGDHRLATDVARAAGELLLEIRGTHLASGTDPAVLRAAGDRAAHEMIAAALARHRPGDPVLSEEAPDDGARLRSRRVWIIDPLDGTREFGEPGRTDWAVHVALVVDGEVAAAAVALPAEGLVLATEPAPVLPPAEGGSPRLAVSRSRPPALVGALAADLGATVHPMGSAGAKAMAVVRGIADVYVHGGGQHEWDSAAPVGVAAAAGLHVSRLDGSALRYNQPDPYLADLLVCRPELAGAVLEALAKRS